ncbi:Carboxyl-terminal protease [hydrothermal vent metagenome]|uniref:Carboxyl-terminal protease n=1 Tax=hydrothermal vent metagenome TaxID=652676 RepID=A0A1W1BBA8_9ZZZZ
MFIKIVYYIALSIIFIGCGSDSLTSSDDTSSLDENDIFSTYIYSDGDKKSSSITQSDCSQKEQNRILYSTMKNNYLWYEYVPDVDYSEYNSTESLLEDLKYREYDRWSYITTTTKYNDYYERGIYGGFGFSFEQYDDRLFVKFVYRNSPAYRVGFRRGTEILEINKKTISEIESENLLSNGGVGTTGVFKIVNSGVEKVVTIEKEIIKTYSIFGDKIIDIDGKRVGYFVLNRFIEPTRSELKIVFEKFKKDGIDELIIDMRYNGGGRISVANYLASLIGEDRDESLFERLEFNDKYTKLNSTINFTKEKNRLNLDRVFIISTDKTCSASEMIINGLRPYMDVHLIGSTTCGKPIGMRGKDFCGKHLSPIEFKLLNADGYGDYFDGITPTCSVSDDIFHSFGDRDESMLKETLFFIENSICSSVNKRYKMQKKSTKDSFFNGFWREIDAI